MRIREYQRCWNSIYIFLNTFELGYRAVNSNKQRVAWWQSPLPTPIDFVVGEKIIFGGLLHNIVQIHNNVLRNWHYSTKYYIIQTEREKYFVSSIPQNIVMDLNHVMQGGTHSVRYLLILWYNGLFSIIVIWYSVKAK